MHSLHFQESSNRVWLRWEHDSTLIQTEANFATYYGLRHVGHVSCWPTRQRTELKCRTVRMCFKNTWNKNTTVLKWFITLHYITYLFFFFFFLLTSFLLPVVWVNMAFSSQYFWSVNEHLSGVLKSEIKSNHRKRFKKAILTWTYPLVSLFSWLQPVMQSQWSENGRRTVMGCQKWVII